MIRNLTMIAMVVGCASTTPSHDRTTLDNIPAAAATTLQQNAGRAEIRAIERGTLKSGVEVYEAQWFEGELEREALVTADGKLVELEVELRAQDVPEIVQAAATRALTGAVRIKWVRLLGDRYEVEGMIDGKERELVFDARGQAAAGGDDDDDDDDDNDGDSDD